MSRKTSKEGSGLTFLIFEDSEDRRCPRCQGNPGLKSEEGSIASSLAGIIRRKIFRFPDDYLKFTGLVQQQKSKLPFYLYAYC